MPKRSQYVIVTGNPFDGLEIHGPFDDGSDANDYASETFDDIDWWVVEIKPVS